MKIINKLASVFNNRSLKAAKWGLMGGQAGLDLGAGAIILGLGIASAPLTLVFTAVAGAIGAGIVAYKLTQPETTPAHPAPAPSAAPSLF